jgi:hypothetical protein
MSHDPADVTRSEQLRTRLLEQLPRWYNPWVHLAIPSLTGLAAISTALWLLEDLRAIQILAVPVTYIFANAVEWWAHKHLLHARNPLAPVLYDRHTPEHHMVYTHENMAIRDRREFRLVLIPAYGIMLIVLATMPVTGLFWQGGMRNVGLLYAATAVAYAVGYEWLHLSYHIDPASWIGSLRIIRILRRHHTVHHNPRLMGRLNFNVTVPLWDHVVGTAAGVSDVAGCCPELADRQAA